MQFNHFLKKKKTTSQYKEQTEGEEKARSFVDESQYENLGYRVMMDDAKKMRFFFYTHKSNTAYLRLMST